MVSHRKKSCLFCAIAACLVCFGRPVLAQSRAGQNLPDAPAAKLLALNAPSQAGSAAPTQGGQVAAADQTSSSANQQPRLTRDDAEKMAIKSNPRVSVGHLLALAQHQVVRETRAANLPTATASLTAMDAENASRISAGALTSSRLFAHAGAGASLTQLITDFGRTRNLVAFSKLQEKSQDASALATEEDVIIATDQAFYNALQAQALLHVA